MTFYQKYLGENKSKAMLWIYFKFVIFRMNSFQLDIAKLIFGSYIAVQ